MVTTIKQALKAFPKGIEKLEIGSGTNPESGYVHLDIQEGLPDLEILSDVRRMPLPDNFVSDHIRAVHIMEHFCHPEYASESMRKKYGTTTEVLSEAYRVLKPGGKLKIVTPDFHKIAESESQGAITGDWLQRWTVGGHLNDYDVHHWLWTFENAKFWMEDIGFHTIENWNPLQGKRRNVKQIVKKHQWHEVEWYHWLFVEGTK